MTRLTSSRNLTQVRTLCLGDTVYEYQHKDSLCVMSWRWASNSYRVNHRLWCDFWWKPTETIRGNQINPRIDINRNSILTIFDEAGLTEIKSTE